MRVEIGMANASSRAIREFELEKRESVAKSWNLVGMAAATQSKMA
jgi:hypothetical protein